MRILIALTYYRPHYSGLTIYAEHEARALAERGHEVTILTSRYDESLKAEEMRHGVRVIRPKVWLHVSKGVIMPSMPVWAWRLIRQVDVVHLHAPQLDAAPMALLSRLLGKPLVLTYHCDLKLPKGLIHSLANWVSDLANHISATAANVVITNTRDYAEHSPFLHRYLNKLIPIYPPVKIEPVSNEELAAFKKKNQIEGSQRIIGIAARLATEKGVEYLVEALPEVLKRYPTARVLFVGPYQNVIGEEAYGKRMMEMIEPLKEHWSFLGVVSPTELAAFFHESEVVVLPSVNSTESYGMVLVEAMTCGTPVITSDLPGMRVPVQNSGCGLLVPPARPDRLAEALIEILEQPSRYTGQPEDLLRLSTPEAAAQEYERLFELLLDRQNAKSEIRSWAERSQENPDRQRNLIPKKTDQ